MYQELELWKAEQAKKRAEQKAEKKKMELLYAAIADCYAMGVQLCQCVMSLCHITSTKSIRL